MSLNLTYRFRKSDLSSKYKVIFILPDLVLLEGGKTRHNASSYALEGSNA